MRAVLVAAVLALASATVVRDDSYYVIGKENMASMDVKMKEQCVMKLLNQILQPTMYEDIREVAREYQLEDNVDKYMKSNVVKEFINTFKMGMLPRGEVFVTNNELHLDQAIKVFRVLYFAKDFDTFIRTACWMRERINGGMFVYALTCACFHREDCRGISIPAPYEIYPYFFVDSHVINKAFMMKMTKAISDPVIMDYYGIKVTDKNVVVIDWRKGVRRALSENDKISYFTEDIDLNTYYYYLHMNYPFWMTDDVYNVNKERRGEIVMYANMQLLARYRLERLAHNMCDVKPLMLNEPLQAGYWPKIRLPTGDEMPVRQNNMIIMSENNIKYKYLLDDVERMLRDGIMSGKIEMRDGTMINLKKPEDIENLARLLLGGIPIAKDDAKILLITNLLRKLLGYSTYNMNKYTYVPTALDMYRTCLRDPVFWMIMKRVTDTCVVFKKMLPKYAREDFDFPGVKVDRFTTEKLVTFMDEYDMDITNALYLDNAELQKKSSDQVFVARMRRLNHQPFKVSIEVTSDKTVDAVVRMFLGPKYDCMGRQLSVNDKRLDMFEIDSFIYKLNAGKNTIVRNSNELQGFLQDRPMTRNIWNRVLETVGGGVKSYTEDYWYKARLGFPQRLMLPLGTLSGLPLQMYVIITPVKTGSLLPMIDLNMMKERYACRWSSCYDSMPLGFPFDRQIDYTCFYTNNMKFADVMVYRKDLSFNANSIKEVDMSDMVMRKDDLTYLDSDMLVRWSYKDVMLMSADNMMRM